MIITAYFVPGIGGDGSSITLKSITDIGIFVIFFMYGLKLSRRELKAGLLNWKLHIAVQVSTFIIFPLLVLLLLPLVHTEQFYIWWLAILFLAALPSTVSSSVVMVSIAKGNVTGAIFNASLSGLLGIVITPLWMGMFMGATAGGDFNYGAILLKLVLQILLPVVLGVLLHKYFGKWAIAHNKKLTWFDKSIILLIIYQSFSSSFAMGIFNTISTTELFVLFAIIIGLFWLMYGSMKLLAKLLKFNNEDSITLNFCGSKKSLMHGTVFSKVLFANSASAGIFLVPIMIYHASQLLIISYIAHKKGAERR